MERAPLDSEVEVSIFGPGYGESLLLHLGNNDWVIVDSCIDSKNKVPAPLNYLHSIDIDPASSVKLIVATHWHDDHIRGLSSIVEECTSADFAFSSALRSEEFFTLISLYGRGSMMKSSGVDEFYKIIKLLNERDKVVKLASENKCLMRVGSREIHALSPSDYSVLSATIQLANLLPEVKIPKRRVLSQKPNHVSVVLQVIIENLCILLGADLEEIGDRRAGWTNIINSQTRIQKKACVFKIPHHGSKSAHLESIWSEMVYPNPISLLTPFTLGKQLPTRKDIRRICSKTDRAYITAKPQWGKRIRRSHTVEKTIRETVRNIKAENQEVGQIRIRLDHSEIGGEWTVKMTDNALNLASLNS
ncbi:MAG: MBL fold metallo-hydrolase [Candidatus Dadabacteria bacterium]|nr:MBL fold metallo-hydrolase [Candidatus Dadabacteria bacterium]